MQGKILNALGDYIIESEGMAAWNNIISQSGVGSQGIYTSIGVYADEELLSLCKELSVLNGSDINEQLSGFGEYYLNLCLNNGLIDLQGYRNIQEVLANLKDIFIGYIDRSNEVIDPPNHNIKVKNSHESYFEIELKNDFNAVVEGVVRALAVHFDQQVDLRYMNEVEQKSSMCCWNIVMTERSQS